MVSVLKGIKVIDIAQVAAVPMAARHLADFGAEVIHVESPVIGDSWRQFVGGLPLPTDISYQFEAFNRNKRGITLDLSHEGGQAVLGRLLKDADVLVTNMRPSEQEKFGIDYTSLHERFSKLIHGSISAAGKEGPERDVPGYDGSMMWFRSGMYYALTMAGRDPMSWRPAFGDTVAALGLFSGIAMAILARQQTGEGQQVDLSLLNMGIYQLSYDISGVLASGTDTFEMMREKMEEVNDTPQAKLMAEAQAELLAAQQRLQRVMRGSAGPMGGRYETKDGRIIALSIVLSDRYHPRLCRALGREDLIDDARFALDEERQGHFAEYYRMIQDTLITKTLEEWRPILDREGIPWAPEQTLREAVDDPQARANDYFVPFDHPSHGQTEVMASPIKLSETPSTIRTPAPEFSQHTEEVLLELGYSWEDIEQFKDQGTIA